MNGQVLQQIQSFYLRAVRPQKTSSCAQATAEVTNFIRGDIDEQSSGICCSIDLEKGFDSLDRRILLAKLKKTMETGVLCKM